MQGVEVKNSMVTRRVVALAAAALVTAGLTAAGTSAVARPTTGATAHVAATGRYIVQFKAGAGAQGRQDLKSAGARIVLGLPRQHAVAAVLPSSRVEQLRQSGAVRLIEPDVLRFPLSQTTPYGVTLTQATSTVVPTPGNRTVCIIDSGYYTGHEDLPANVTGSADGGAGPWYQDGFGHGTHVAGTVAAVDNGLGVVGVDPGVNLHIVRVFGNDGAWAYASTLINMSLGGATRNRVEQQAFDQAYAAGVLPVAAAGNGGSKRISYPAGYASVVSVAAIDANSVHADFSQTNRDVELAAPGVGVLSTLPFVDTATLTVGGQTFTGIPIEDTGHTNGVSGTLVDGGLCDTAGSWSGKVVLCQRGTITFAAKVQNVVTGGGVAAVIYNNVAGDLNATTDPTVFTLPAISLTQADGQTALASVGQPATVVNSHVAPASGYAAWDGTSMATPHVAGIAAKVWSCHPAWTNVQVRKALDSSAHDLGAAGRDRSYGFGLVQAADALAALKATTGISTCD